MKNLGEFLALLGLSLAVGAVLIGTSLFWYTFCFLKLYGWFVLSVIPGAPEFTFRQAMGFSVLASLMVNQYVPIDHDNKRQVFGSLAFQFMAPAMSLFIGWLIK